MKNLRNKGITLISLTVAVCILIVISSMLIYNAKSGVEIRKLKMLQNDLAVLDDAINSYYAKYNALPIKIEYDVMPLPFFNDISPNDNEAYYVIDLTALEGITLNYGVAYEHINTQEDLLEDENEDVYVINEQSHRIYYARGIEMDGVVYYTSDVDEEVNLVPIAREELSVEDLLYEKLEDGSYKITLKNVQFNKTYNVEYREANESTYSKVGTDIETTDFTFEVDKYGLYYIKVADRAGQNKQIIASIYAEANITEDNVKLKMVKEIDGDEITEGQVAPPKDFTISGIDSECAGTLIGVAEENEKDYTIDDGVVLYLLGDEKVDWSDSTAVEKAQKTYDQFVWVPVLNPVLDLRNTTAINSEDGIREAVGAEVENGNYPMAIQKDDNNYFGVLYLFERDYDDYKIKVRGYNYDWTPLEVPEEETETESYREPAYLDDTEKGDESSYNTIGITESSLQIQYNNMVNKVKNNKGFWVGRYETSKMYGGTSDEDNSKDLTQRIEVVKAAEEGLSGMYINWYRMYEQQKNYSKLVLGSDTQVGSGMIWGSQWDQIMIWMKDVENKVSTKYSSTTKYYIFDPLGMGNHGIDKNGDTKTKIEKEPTGNSQDYRVKNIYDLAGNIGELTAEANDSYYRVLRGSYYFFKSAESVTLRRSVYPYYDIDDKDYYGSRITIY